MRDALVAVTTAGPARRAGDERARRLPSDELRSQGRRRRRSATRRVRVRRSTASDGAWPDPDGSPLENEAGPAGRESTSWRSMRARATACPTVRFRSNPIRICCFMRRVYDTLLERLESTAGFTYKEGPGWKKPASATSSASKEGRRVLVLILRSGSCGGSTRSRRRRVTTRSSAWRHHRRLLLLAGVLGSCSRSGSTSWRRTGRSGRLAAQELRFSPTWTNARSPVASRGLTDNKIIAMDEIWSALRFVEKHASGALRGARSSAPAGSVRLTSRRARTRWPRRRARQSPPIDLTVLEPMAAGFAVLPSGSHQAPSYEPHLAAARALRRWRHTRASTGRVVLTASPARRTLAVKLLCDAGDEVLGA